MKKLYIAVVIPVFGCPDALQELHDRLNNVLVDMNVTYEMIFVDDCDNMGS